MNCIGGKRLAELCLVIKSWSFFWDFSYCHHAMNLTIIDWQFKTNVSLFSVLEVFKFETVCKYYVSWNPPMKWRWYQKFSVLRLLRATSCSHFCKAKKLSCKFKNILFVNNFALTSSTLYWFLFVLAFFIL